jgi:alkylation response protein AidB-like acyl-CoA dehydrogenase
VVDAWRAIYIEERNTVVRTRDGQALGRFGFPFTDEQLCLADEVGAYAQEHFAPIAARWDRENRFPDENFRALHRQGWLRIPIDPRHGGIGKGIHHDPLAWVLVIEALSKACSNTGQTFQIWGHCISMIEELGTPEQAERLDCEALAGAVICSCGSEPASYTQARRPQAGIGQGTVAVPVDGGFRLTGRKLFISNAGAADIFFTFATLQNRDGSPAGLVHPVVRRDTPGLRVEMNWDALGMRGTASDDVVFEEIAVRADDVIGLDQPNAYYRSILAGSFLTGRSAVYLGIAEAALDFAVAYIRDRIGVGEDSLMQYRVGELEMTRQAAASMLYRSAWQWEQVIAGTMPAAQAASFTTQTHTFTGLAALRITEEALELCGGRGMLRNAPLERYHRDIRAYTVSPPTRSAAMRNLGSQLLAPQEQRESLVREGT